MNRFIALNSTQHRELGWHATPSLHFAAKTDTAPVLLEELPHLIATLPLAFLAQPQSDASHRFQAVALFSLTPDHNLFITPDGRWLGGYLPAALRAYPFRLQPRGEQEGLALCFDQGSGLLTDPPTDEQRFFNADGEPSTRLAAIMAFMQNCERGRQTTETATQLLAEHDLIKPWPIQLSLESGEHIQVKGLHRVDEAALKALSGDALHHLQQGHALSLAYAQILSQHRLQGLSKLHDLHMRAQQEQRAAANTSVDDMFSTQDDTLKFDF